MQKQAAADPRTATGPHPGNTIVGIAFVVVVAIAVFAVARQRAGALDQAPAAAAAPTATAAQPAAASRAGDDEPPPARRAAALATADGTTAAAPTFADYLERLVAHGLETMRLAALGDTDRAHASDAAARALFAEMLRLLPAADGEALALLSSAAPPAPSAPAADQLRHRVLLMALDHGLQLRTATADQDPANRPAVLAARDALVGAVLTAMVGDAELAQQLGLGVLADAPYLGPPHEAAVLELAAMSGEGGFSAEVATALLTTLWRNLQRAGHPSSERLQGLCLLLLDGGNRSERLAAARLLLADARYRPVVLDHLRTTGDAALGRELAMAAAQDLPPAEAFAVVAAAASAGDTPAGQSAPFLLLGHRDAAMLQREYEQRLAADREPRLRELMVAGAGFSGTAEGTALARLAFESDPDADVRLRALLALTGQSGPAFGERAVFAALDDARIRDDALRLRVVVMAVENLARAGLVNEVARCAARLRLCTHLDAEGRAALEQLLAERLPRGELPIDSRPVGSSPPGAR